MSAAAPALYVATAYRWGWLNAHHYLVYVGPDREKAIAAANEIPEDRGGKYGCQVVQIQADGTPGEAIHHAPSIYREPQPYHNYRIDMYQTLGHQFHEFAAGRAFLSDETRPGTLKPVEVTPPQWVVDEVADEERRAAAFAEAPGVPTIKEYQDRFDKDSREISVPAGLE